MNRREALKSLLPGAGAVLGSRFEPELRAPARRSEDPVPPKGAEWNESFLFPDEATTRLTRRLTTRRTYNHKPTYHINQGFSPESRYLVLCTWNPGGDSALVRADVETGDLKVIDRAAAGEPFQFNSGNAIALIPHTPLALYRVGAEIRLYDIHTSEHRVINVPRTLETAVYSSAAGTADGKRLILARTDKPYNRFDKSIDPYGVLGSSVLMIDLASERVEELYRDDTHRIGHVIPSPTDPALVLIDRDSPPLFSVPNCAADVPRNWILHVDSGRAWEIRPRSGCNFTWHGNWSHRGDHVYYHGLSAERVPRWLAERYPNGYPAPYKGQPGAAHFIGVATVEGATVWEQEYPVVYYGHVSSHATKDVVIIDNLIAPDLLSGIHWRELDAHGLPRIDLYGKHNSTYVSGQQMAHAHSQMSPDGRWLSYNSGVPEKDHTDVYVMEM